MKTEENVVYKICGNMSKSQTENISCFSKEGYCKMKIVKQ